MARLDSYHANYGDIRLDGVEGRGSPFGNSCRYLQDRRLDTLHLYYSH